MPHNRRGGGTGKVGRRETLTWLVTLYAVFGPRPPWELLWQSPSTVKSPKAVRVAGTLRIAGIGTTAIGGSVRAPS